MRFLIPLIVLLMLISVCHAQVLDSLTVGTQVLQGLSGSVVGYSFTMVADGSGYVPQKTGNCHLTGKEKKQVHNALLVRGCGNHTVNVYLSDSHPPCSPCTYDGTFLDWSDSTRYANDGSNYRDVEASVYSQWGTFVDATGATWHIPARLNFTTWWSSYQDENFPVLMGGTFAVELGQN